MSTLISTTVVPKLFIPQPKYIYGDYAVTHGYISEIMVFIRKIINFQVKQKTKTNNVNIGIVI